MSKSKKRPTGNPSGNAHDRRVARRVKAGKKEAFKNKAQNENVQG